MTTNKIHITALIALGALFTLGIRPTHAQTLNPVADTTITVGPNLGGANAILGADPTIYVIAPGGFFSYGLVKFDIAPGTVITSSATLRMFTTVVFAGGTGPISLYPVLQNWNEATTTWNTFGGVSFGSNVDTTAFAMMAGAGTPQGAYIETTIPQSIVEGWRDSPATNFGFLMHATSGRDTDFASREATENHPQLVLNTAPEPGTLGLLALGMLGGVVVRNRKGVKS